MDDPNPFRKAEIARDLYHTDQSVNICLYPRRAGLGSHCQLNVHLGSSYSHVCGTL